LRGEEAKESSLTRAGSAEHAKKATALEAIFEPLETFAEATPLKDLGSGERVNKGLLDEAETLEHINPP
jgi:hypothetical protein